MRPYVLRFDAATDKYFLTKHNNTIMFNYEVYFEDKNTLLKEMTKVHIKKGDYVDLS